MTGLPFHWKHSVKLLKDNEKDEGDDMFPDVVVDITYYLRA